MLKTYRIIPLVFILFLFGFTLFTVAPVFAADSAAFKQCQATPKGKRAMATKKACYAALARALQDQLDNSMPPVASTGRPVDPAILRAENDRLNGEVETAKTTVSNLETVIRDQESKLTKTTAENDRLNGEVETEKKNVTHIEGVMKSMVEDYKKSTDKIVRLNGEVETAKTTVSNLETVIRDQESKLTKTTNDLKAANVELEQVKNGLEAALTEAQVVDTTPALGDIAITSVDERAGAASWIADQVFAYNGHLQGNLNFIIQMCRQGLTDDCVQRLKPKIGR
jgi:predicted  nucleic acid-binding Zn-ribbon protein